MPEIIPNKPADASTYLAAERTLLAWVRTGLAMMGFGFVVARFGLFLREIASLKTSNNIPHSTGHSLWVGIALVLLGVIVNLIATARYVKTLKQLDSGEPLRFTPLSLGTIVAVALAILGLVTITFLLAGLH